MLALTAGMEGAWACHMRSAVQHNIFDCVYWRPIWQLTEFPTGILKSNYLSFRQEAYIFASLQTLSLVFLQNILLAKPDLKCSSLDLDQQRIICLAEQHFEQI